MGNTLTEGLRALISLYGWGDRRDADLFKASADIIDEEHEKACEKAYGDGAKSVPIAVDKSQWIRLPKDANGEVIHIGDVMKSEKIGGGFCGPFEVVGYIMSNGELEPMDEYKHPRKHEYLHHHKQQTVEDVLCEMIDAVDDDRYGQDRIIAKYAAKLCLANDGKEQ